MTAIATRKFSRDVAWNVASLGISGICGIALQYLISVVYDVAALGAFNQVFAIYLLASQLAVLGVHQSALQSIAVADGPAEEAAVATSALVVTLMTAAGVALLVWFGERPIGALSGSPDVARGMVWAAPGVFFFALNKVGLGCLNGRAQMRWYAVLSAGRFLLMLAAFGACVAGGADAALLPVVLTAGEGGTLLLLLIPTRDLLCRLQVSELRKRARAHLEFGTKGVMSGLLSELNTRVDVLMLGFFHSDAVVGVYSFAAILAEGLFQLLIVLRQNYAPTVARFLGKNQRRELMQVVRRGQLRTYLVALPVGALAIGFYALVVPIVTNDPALVDSWALFAVLIGGMVACSGYVPFSQVLLHGRLPGWHSIYILAVASMNIVANAALIPVYGALGAAMGTAIAFVASAVLVSMFSRRLLSLPL